MTLAYGVSQSVGLTADPDKAANCASGCTATFNILGRTPNATGTKINSSPIIVTFNSSGGGGNGNYTVTVSPSSVTLVTGETQQFTATTNDPEGVVWLSPGLGTLSNITTSSVTYTAGGNPGSDTLTAKNKTDQSASGSASITINQPQVKPTVNLSVSPSAVAYPGGQATLTWTTTNAATCSAFASRTPKAIGADRSRPPTMVRNLQR